MTAKQHFPPSPSEVLRLVERGENHAPQARKSLRSEIASVDGCRFTTASLHGRVPVSPFRQRDLMSSGKLSTRKKGPSRSSLAAEAVIVGNAAGYIPAERGEHEFTAPFTRDFVFLRGKRRRIHSQRFADAS